MKATIALVLFVAALMAGAWVLGNHADQRRRDHAIERVRGACGPDRVAAFRRVIDHSRTNDAVDDESYIWARRCVVGGDR